MPGPSARTDLNRAQKIAYDHGLKTILEPRMVALLEATMWREIRNPEFLLGALKSYHMLTGKAPYDRDFLTFWWTEKLPESAPIPPFPTEAALAHQLAAIDRAAGDEAADRIAPDDLLVSKALEAICTVPLSVRAYTTLMENSAVTSLPDWIPAEIRRAECNQGADTAIRQDPAHRPARRLYLRRISQRDPASDPRSRG